jgi:hypothetical protein
MGIFNKRNAIIGWLVVTLGKPAAKYKAKQAVSGGKRRGVIAGTAAAIGAAVGGLMFWRKRRSGSESPES